MADFFERAEPVFTLYTQGRYAEALHLTDELARDFPDRAIYTSYWKICLLAVSNQREAALQVMEEAIAQGLWWSTGRLHEDPDLKELQGDPKFEYLAAISMERYAAAAGRSKPELLILEPGGAAASPLPLLLVLHGRDGNAEREKSHWEGARDLGWLTAIAQSSQIGSHDSYVWDDVALAQKEIHDHFIHLQEKYALDVSRILIAGFSQGGAIAILAAVKATFPCTAFLAVAPGRLLSDYDLSALAESTQPRGLHGVIVIGGKDPRFETMVQVSETLSSHGVPCRLEIRPDLGHAYPDDFREYLERTLSAFHKEKE